MSLGFFVPMRSVSEIVGAEIRRIRSDQKLLQRELADGAALPLRTIGRIERGEVDVRLSTLAKIAKALRVSLKSLLP